MIAKVTELDIEVSNVIWSQVRWQNLDLWGYESKNELLEDVAKQRMSAGPWQYWATRFHADRLFEPGNLRLVRVQMQTDKAKLLHPSYPVTESITKEVAVWV